MALPTRNAMSIGIDEIQNRLLSLTRAMGRSSGSVVVSGAQTVWTRRPFGSFDLSTTVADVTSGLGSAHFADANRHLAAKEFTQAPVLANLVIA